MSKTIKKNEPEQCREDDDLPFGGPSEWYPYYCRACECRMWVEDIIIDAFPPDGPGKCPLICCPQCGKDFVMDITRDTIMSETDPNHQ